MNQVARSAAIHLIQVWLVKATSTSRNGAQTHLSENFERWVPIQERE